MHFRIYVGILGGLLLSLGIISPVWSLSPQERRSMQNQLNERVMEQPFSVPSEDELNQQLDDAKKRGEVPQSNPPKGWRHGWTCANLLGYGYYYQNYYDCRYYHRYYGRYWW